MLQVIKIGGAALNDATWLSRFAEAAAIPVQNARVIVHGGGPEITELSALLGIATQFHEGRRITSEAALDVTSMVLNGRINKRVVRALRARGVDAFGLSGEDGAVISGQLAEGGALGRVGKVLNVRTGLLERLLAEELVPVLSPVSLGIDFAALNINADEVAAAVAQQMSAQELLFLTDVDGVRAEGARLPAITRAEVQRLIATEGATGGMALKLRAALAALAAGVSKVRIGSLEMLWDEHAGTTVEELLPSFNGGFTAEEIACR